MTPPPSRLRPLPSFLAVQAAGLASFLVLQFVFQFVPTFRLTADAVWSLVGYHAVLSIALVLGTGHHRLARRSAPDWARSDAVPPSAALFATVSGLAWAGVGLRIIDRFLLRPELVGSNIDLTNQASTAVGALASMLYPLGVVLAPVMVATGRRFPPRAWVSAWVLFAFPAIDVFVVGKRGVAVTLLGMLLLLVAALGVRARPYLFLGAVVALGTAAVVATAVFLTRILSYGFDLCYSLYNSGYTYTVRPSEATAEACREDGPFAIVWQAANNFGMYYLHGMYEFSYRLDFTQSGSDWGWGRATFGTLLKPLCMVNESAALCAYDPPLFREGVYTTFWGPWLQDFSPAMLPSVFVLGLALALVQNCAERSIAWLPLYLYCGAVVFFMPVVNLVQSALGTYLLAACVLFIILFNLSVRSRRAHRLRRSPGQDRTAAESRH